MTTKPAKIVIVVTNHGILGDTGEKTGWYLPEVAHPYKVFTKAGYEVEFVSPQGGYAPMDPGSAEQFKDDSGCQEFLKQKEVMEHLQHTKAAVSCKAKDYKAIFYAGGHGPMWDLTRKTLNCDALAHLAADIYENGGVLSAVCHGTVGFIPIRLPIDGQYVGKCVVEGQKITSFTDSEEIAVKLDGVVPFALESKLKELGADFQGVEDFQVNVQVSNRIVTGQNPASATKTAEEVVKLMKT